MHYALIEIFYDTQNLETIQTAPTMVSSARAATDHIIAAEIRDIDKLLNELDTMGTKEAHGEIGYYQARRNHMESWTAEFSEHVATIISSPFHGSALYGGKNWAVIPIGLHLLALA